MNKYTKIEAIYNRDMEGTKKLIEGSFCNDTVEYLKDNEWVCTEKIDGTNVGVVWDGHRVSYQGRSENSSLPVTLEKKLNELFGGEINEEIFEQKFGEKSVILFGEGYGAKIQKNGDKYRSDVSFILFDVYLPDSNLWFKRESIEDVAKSFGIEVVPIILRGKLQQAVDFVKNKPKSTIGTADMEGLVCKPTVEIFDRLGRRVIVKVKVRDFV